VRRSHEPRSGERVSRGREQQRWIDVASDPGERGKQRMPPIYVRCIVPRVLSQSVAHGDVALACAHRRDARVNSKLRLG
jgi:hypothetical protein